MRRHRTKGKLRWVQSAKGQMLQKGGQEKKLRQKSQQNQQSWEEGKQKLGQSLLKDKQLQKGKA